ncbi:MAG: hypothetical protein ACJZ2J_01810 [Candidatus Poseidoniales archaeon]
MSVFDFFILASFGFSTVLFLGGVAMWISYGIKRRQGARIASRFAILYLVLSFLNTLALEEIHYDIYDTSIVPLVSLLGFLVVSFAVFHQAKLRLPRMNQTKKEIGKNLGLICVIMDERSFTIITVAILIISPILLYMNSDETLEQDSSINDSGLVPVWERINQNFNTTGSYSYTLESGQYGTLGPESVFIDVDLPSSELGCTITDDCQVHLGLWLPDVPNGTKIPVIADVGPYYDDGDVDALTPANRLGKFFN